MLHRRKVLERSAFHEDCYLLAIDGSGYFSSKRIYFDACLQRKKKIGEIMHHQQMLGTILVHPGQKKVIVLAPEPITTKQNGDNKNDCKRTGAKSVLHKVGQEHSKLRPSVIEDGLASNAGHFRLLKHLRMDFLPGAKPPSFRSSRSRFVSCAAPADSHLIRRRLLLSMKLRYSIDRWVL
jgi:hypothetical protein